MREKLLKSILKKVNTSEVLQTALQCDVRIQYNITQRHKSE